MSSPNKPNQYMPIPYVNYGGTQMLRPPYVAENVSLYGFVVKADMGAMQKMLDNRLNLPSGGEEHFEPAGPFVIIAFNKLEKMYSQNPPDRGKGWFSEQECAIWMRVIDCKRERSLWFHPYIFVDDSYAMALGREVYGFPKAFGWFQIPDDPATAKTMSMETLVLPVFSPNTRGVRAELIRATKTAESGDETKEFETAIELGAELMGLLGGENGMFDEAEVVCNSVVDMVLREEPMVFLKQFPTPDVPGIACYQAIVECQAQATKVDRISLVPGEWQIDITAAASHPIALDLGLSGDRIQSALQFFVGFDMVVGLGTNVWTAQTDPPKAQPKRIAILGGGVGSMATALELTSDKNWQSRYDITVYQMGWRLGGKGASGRGVNNRIQEHGLHIWLGFYENAFRIMRQVYDENKANRPPGSPLREWDEAFKKHNLVAVTDRTPNAAGTKWEVWPFLFPDTPGTPGDGTQLTLWQAIMYLIEGLLKVYVDSEFHKRGAFAIMRPGFTPDILPIAHIELAHVFALRIDGDRQKQSQADHDELAKQLVTFRESVRQRIQPDLDAGVSNSRYLFEIIDLAVSLGSGLLFGGYLLDPGKLDTLDEEMQSWLKKQGASPIASEVKQSAILRALYDLVFAYVNGDAEQPSFEAGVAVRCILLIVSYKGGIFWKMQAGMGDVVFGPMYQVLKSRGVKFEFFHRVSGLDLSPSGMSVDAIHFDVQATLKHPEEGYDPLVVCENLPSWPAEPQYDQLVEGEALQKGGYDLESFWTTWVNPGSKTLRAGIDYDQIVLGISLGALPFLFSEPEKLPQRFQLMLKNVQTVRTQAMQLWVNRNLEQLKWTQGDVVLDSYVDPLNTWAVMDQLIERESFPAGSVLGIHYFCGQMEGGIPPREDVNAPAKALDELKAAAAEFKLNGLPFLWPGMNDPEYKVVSEFLRVNIDPTERYVLSVAGSTNFRLRADESGLTNVVLAGDWTRNGLNAGCVEAATISGIQASNAIQGRKLNDGIDGPVSEWSQSEAGAPPIAGVAVN